MKKFALISISMLLALFVSCNKSSNDNSVDIQETEFSELKEQIISLNASLPQNGEISTKAKWWKYLLVAVGDAGGFFLGGGASAGGAAVTAGCAVSTLVWNLVKDEKKAETKANLGGELSSNFNEPGIALSCVDGAGLVHNRVILDLYEDNGEALFGYSEENLIPLVAEKVALETNCTLDEACLSLPEQHDIVNRTVSAYSSSSTIDEFINKLELV